MNSITAELEELIKHAIAMTWPIYGRIETSSVAHHALNSEHYESLEITEADYLMNDDRGPSFSETRL